MARKIMEYTLGDLQPGFEDGVERLKSNRIPERIWKLDHTVWKPEPKEITNRLGWLWIARHMERNLGEIFNLVDAVRTEGYRKVLLLGMGGSSLAPEIFRRIFGVKDGYLDLHVLDSTSPGMVETMRQEIELEKTLFIVSTKSGGTVETLSFFKYFYNLAVAQLGPEAAGAHFIAITDPGSKLEKIALDFGFRKAFLNDPHIGGRFSALSFFGLVPAALLGVDIREILQRGAAMTLSDDLAAALGTILGVGANKGRDKVTFLISERYQAFGDWVEQLIAESTGKEGKGILPVVHEPLGKPQVYGEDRLFVHIKLEETSEFSAGVTALRDAGHPVVEFHLDDLYDLGGQFFLWEYATAVAGYFLEVNPFNQPNVESAKVLARKMVAAYQESGELPEGDSKLPEPAALQKFLANSKPGDYIALQAYIQPTEENTDALQNLRLQLRDHYKLATTLGYGPRFLHSTGQLHKGDGGNGLFIQFITRPKAEVPIPEQAGEPESSITFGTLILAQALGDGQALLEEGRRFIRFRLPVEGTASAITALS